MTVYIFDPKKNRLVIEDDETARYIVVWADKGCCIRARQFHLSELKNFFDTLPYHFSKIIFNPLKREVHVEHEGSIGLQCKDLFQFIIGIDVDEEEQHHIISKRVLSNFRLMTLPKSLAALEFDQLKGYSISKILVNPHTGLVLESVGPDVDACLDYYSILRDNALNL